MTKHMIASCVIWTLLTTSGALHADEAKRAFQEGTTLYRNDQFAEAADAFRKAHRLKPSWKILFNIGQCSAAAKQYGMALEAFEGYLSQGGDDVTYEKRQNVINEIKILREMVGFLDISAPDNCEVRVDGHKRGTTPLPGPIPVGSGINHQLEVFESGTPLLTKTVRVNSGQTITIDSLPKKEPEKEAAVTENTPTAGSAGNTETATENDEADNKETPKKFKVMRIIGVVSAGIGLGAFGGSLFGGLKTMTLSDQLNKRTCIANECDSITDDMQKFQLITNVLVGVGATFVVTGATLIIVSFVANGSDKEDDETSLRLAPVLAPQTAGLSLSYSF